MTAEPARLADRLKRCPGLGGKGERQRKRGAGAIQRPRKQRQEVRASNRCGKDPEDGDRQQESDACRCPIEGGLPGPCPSDDRDWREVDQHVMAEPAERRAEQDGDGGERGTDFPRRRASPTSVCQPHVDHHQEQQTLEKGAAVDERRRQGGDRPRTPGQGVSDHGPRRRRLITPRLRSNVAAPPTSSHGQIAADFGVRLVEPLMGSTDRALVDTLGTAASRLVAGVEAAVGGAVAVGAARTAAGALAVWVAAIGGTATLQTWPKPVDGGGAPYADV